jgi:hypothetical protein
VTCHGDLHQETDSCNGATLGTLNGTLSMRKR